MVDEAKANSKPFDYHFTGKDSRLFLLHVMSLISECSWQRGHDSPCYCLHLSLFEELCFSFQSLRYIR